MKILVWLTIDQGDQSPREVEELQGVLENVGKNGESPGSWCGVESDHPISFVCVISALGWRILIIQLHLTNKKHLKNVGPIRYCEPPLHWQSLGVASRMPAIAIAQVACDVHNDDDDNNDNAWQRGPLWPNGMGPITSMTAITFLWQPFF